MIIDVNYEIVDNKKSQEEKRLQKMLINQMTKIKINVMIKQMSKIVQNKKQIVKSMTIICNN